MSTVTYEPVKLSEIKNTVWPLLLKHWDEIALNKNKVPLDPDWDYYFQLENAGAFQAIGALDENGTIVGYSSYFMQRNPHYKSLCMAIGDIFYLDPAYRKGWAGVGLLSAAEKHLYQVFREQRDEASLYVVHKEKVHFPIGSVLTRLRYKLIEHYYAKLLER